MTSASSTENVSANAHVPWLDGLRGIAAFWVLASHVQILSGMRRVPVLSWGGLAVDVFMMLSGFLMAHLALARSTTEPWSQGTTWQRFWTRRFFRIAPLYYVLLLAALALGPFLGEMRELIAAQWPQTATSPGRYFDQSFTNILTHVSFVFGVLPQFAFKTALPDWSIGLEMQFYLVFPLLFWLAGRIGSIAVGLSAIVICLAATLLFTGYFQSFEMPAFLPMKLYVFLFGMWIAFGRSQRSLRRHFIVAVIVAAVFCVIERNQQAVFRAMLVSGMFYLMNDGQLPSVGWVDGLIKQLRSWLSSRLAGFLGDTSFGVYLIHLLFLLPIAGHLTTSSTYLHLPQFARFLICLVCVLPPSYLLAWLLHRLVEQPGIRLGNLMVRKIPTHSILAPNAPHTTAKGSVV